MNLFEIADDSSLNELFALHPDLGNLFKTDANAYAWLKQYEAKRCTIEELLVGLAIHQHIEVERVRKSHRPIRHGQFLDRHFRGEDKDGSKFVYCPIGRIASWSAGDYDHRYCPYCGIFYETGVKR